MKIASGRPFDIAVRDIQEQQERDSMRALLVEEQMRDALKKMSDVPGMEGFADLIMAQMLAASQSTQRQLPKPAELKRKAVESAAYERAGLYMEAEPIAGGGQKVHLWDFERILRTMTNVEFETGPVQEDGMIVTTIEVNTEHEQYQFRGTVAGAFMQYLHYLGVFAVQNSKMPCPECGTNRHPGECDTCGGLGWVLRGETREPQPQPERA